MTYYCFEEEHIRLSKDVYQKQNKVKFLINVMHHHMEDTLQETEQPRKILQSGFYWLILLRDCSEWVKCCDRCQRMDNINRRNEMPLQGILAVLIFYVWRIDFMGPFPPSFGNLYILLVEDYVSKWVEAIYVWRIYFIGPFPPSYGNLYILLVVDYVSKLGGSHSLSHK